MIESPEVQILQDLIIKNPDNHAFKVSFLEKLKELKMLNDLEISIYTFLAHIEKDDPYFSIIESFIKDCKSGVSSQEEDINSEKQEEENNTNRERISFDEVGGMEHVKKRIEQMIINPFKNEALYKAYNKKIGGGLLLYGPPGCGKTHIARAIAEEIKGKFISVSLHQILDMYTGNSEKNLHNIFQKARQNTPCVLFFDEVDALSFNRSKAEEQNFTGNQIINQFLNELDGIEHSNEKILIIGATNLPWNIDSAFRRPGRFDHILFTPPPNTAAREKIFEMYINEKPHEEKIDYTLLAKKTEGFSGADIKHLINEVGMESFEQAIETNSLIKISQKQIISKIPTVNPSTNEWFEIAQRYIDYSNLGGKYDEIKEYLDKK